MNVTEQSSPICAVTLCVLRGVNFLSEMNIGEKGNTNIIRTVIFIM